VSKSRQLEQSSSRVKSTVGAVPWLVLARGAMILGKRWNALSAKERARLAELVRESHGRVGNLSVKQRLELRKLAGKLDLKGVAGELTSLWRGGRSRRGRKRH
jgi:hypothetical protein